jgi:hypothetical protein
MPFEKGRLKTGGRQTGVPNRLTGAFREAVLFVYDGLGGHAAFLEWARENPTEYYKIAARLIPAEMRDDGGGKQVTVIVDRRAAIRQALPSPLHVETIAEE